MMEWSHKLYHKISPPFTRLLIRCGITANMVTIFNFFFTVFGAGYYFSRGTYNANFIALAFMIGNVILDYADGDIAKATGRVSPVGVWLDNHGDCIVHNVIMGAIAIGCYKLGMGVWWIVMFYIGNSTLNMVSFHFNKRFGFESYKGSELFRRYMEEKPTAINRFFKNLIDPTSSAVGIFFYTVRYFVLLGIFFNEMSAMFMIITVITILRGAAMYIIYALHLAEYKKLWVLQALAIIDEDRQEFIYAIQGSKTI